MHTNSDNKVIGFFNTLGIDSIRFIVQQEILLKFLTKRGYQIETILGDPWIVQYFEHKYGDMSRLKFVKINKGRSINSLIILRHTDTCEQREKKNKKRGGYYVEVVFAGLRQPFRDIDISTYDVLAQFVKRFEVFNIDVCVDGENKTQIDRLNKHVLRRMFEPWIKRYTDTNIHYSTFYVNAPVETENQTYQYSKIVFYDKFLKEAKYKHIEEKYEKWKRLEVTVPLHGKLGIYMLEDLTRDIAEMAKHCFGDVAISDEFFHKQVGLLLDRRRIKSKTLTLH